MYVDYIWVPGKEFWNHRRLAYLSLSIIALPCYRPPGRLQWLAPPGEWENSNVRCLFRFVWHRPTFVYRMPTWLWRWSVKVSTLIVCYGAQWFGDAKSQYNSAKLCVRKRLNLVYFISIGLISHIRVFIRQRETPVLSKTELFVFISAVAPPEENFLGGRCRNLRATHQ